MTHLGKKKNQKLTPKGMETTPSQLERHNLSFGARGKRKIATNAPKERKEHPRQREKTKLKAPP